MGCMIGIDTPLLLLVARSSYTRTATLEGRGCQEVLTDGILVLQWTIIVAMCSTFQRHVLTVFLARRSSFPSIANCPTCPLTNIYVPSPTNYPNWPCRQIPHPKANICCACYKHVCIHFSILLLLSRQNKGWMNTPRHTKHDKG